LFKKARWLLTVISLRFSSSSSEYEDDIKPSFPLPDLEKEPLPVFADNVLPSTLFLLSLVLPFAA
jgi:hypothetical protein